MDLEPFQRINPCGHEGLAITQLAALGAPDDVSRVAAEVVPDLLDMLSRNTHAQK
jgi:lipoyl(octanoyl) transferase